MVYTNMQEAIRKALDLKTKLINYYNPKIIQNNCLKGNELFGLERKS